MMLDSPSAAAAFNRLPAAARTDREVRPSNPVVTIIVTTQQLARAREVRLRILKAKIVVFGFRGINPHTAIQLMHGPANYDVRILTS